MRKFTNDSRSTGLTRIMRMKCFFGKKMIKFIDSAVEGFKKQINIHFRELDDLLASFNEEYNSEE